MLRKNEFTYCDIGFKKSSSDEYIYNKDINIEPPKIIILQSACYIYKGTLFKNILNPRLNYNCCSTILAIGSANIELENTNRNFNLINLPYSMDQDKEIEFRELLNNVISNKDGCLILASEMFSRSHLYLLTSDILNKFDLIIVPISDEHLIYSLHHAVNILIDLDMRITDSRKLQTCIIYQESPTNYFKDQINNKLTRILDKKRIFKDQNYLMLKDKLPIWSFFLNKENDEIENEINFCYLDLLGNPLINVILQQNEELVDKYDFEVQDIIEKQNELQFNRLINFISEIRAL